MNRNGNHPIHPSGIHTRRCTKGVLPDMPKSTGDQLSRLSSQNNWTACSGAYSRKNSSHVHRRKNVSRRCSRESSWYSSSSSILECKRRVLAAYSLCSTRLPRLRNWPPIGGGRRTVHPTTRGIFCTSLCFSDSSSILSKTRLLRPGEVSRSRRPVSNAKTVVSTVIFCLWHRMIIVKLPPANCMICN